jgi:hypothetical protein
MFHVSMFSPNLFLVHARPIPAGEWGPRVATAGDLCVVLRDAIFQSNNRVRLGQARLYVHLQSCICVLCCESCRPLIAQFCDAAWCAYVCTPFHCHGIRTVSLWEWQAGRPPHKAYTSSFRYLLFCVVFLVALHTPLRVSRPCLCPPVVSSS